MFHDHYSQSDIAQSATIIGLFVRNKNRDIKMHKQNLKKKTSLQLYDEHINQLDQ